VSSHGKKPTGAAEAHNVQLKSGVSPVTETIIKTIAQPATTIPAAPRVYASAKKTEVPALVLKRVILPPDSCGDLITFMDGEELRVKIEEISPDYVAYRRCDYLTGPLIKTKPSNIFRIKYVNGMLRVFEHKETVSQVPQYQAPTQKKTNGWAVASFVSSLLFVLFVPPFAAVIMGIVALVQFENHPEKYKGRGFAVAGLIIGVIGVALILLLAFL